VEDFLHSSSTNLNRTHSKTARKATIQDSISHHIPSKQIKQQDKAKQDEFHTMRLKKHYISLKHKRQSRTVFTTSHHSTSQTDRLNKARQNKLRFHLFEDISPKHLWQSRCRMSGRESPVPRFHSAQYTTHDTQFKIYIVWCPVSR